MKVLWTRKASSDLVRLHEFLKAASPRAAARVIQELVRAPDRLCDFPRIGEKLDAFAPREVRRVIIGQFEMRYELAEASIVILRVWHCREYRSPDSET
jgi:plasmid stabilization system protein ParE